MPLNGCLLTLVSFIQARQSQWQTLTLFLTAFAVSVSQESHDPRALTHIVPAHHLPDQMCSLRDPDALLNEFLTYVIDLLVSKSQFARDVARDAIGSELSPKLYVRVFKYLDE